MIGAFFFPLREALLSVLEYFFLKKKKNYIPQGVIFFSNFPQSKNGDNLFEINLKKGGGASKQSFIQQVFLRHPWMLSYMLDKQRVHHPPG